MKNLRKYGNSPFDVAVVHGGPGAAGEMAPVARELSSHRGILEPLQTAASVDGQVQELSSILKNHGNLHLTLIGHSWGAWLAFILAAQHPSLVRKLILIGSAPFEDSYARDIMKTRLDRLNEKDRSETAALMESLEDPAIGDKGIIMGKLGKLISKADSYDPLPHNNELVKPQSNIYQSVWPEAAELRRSGKLLELAQDIECPVVSIHGDYDPHPSEGVERPLSQAIKEFRFILLKDCGHEPWIERRARDRFYEILKKEIGESSDLHRTDLIF